MRAPIGLSISSRRRAIGLSQAGLARQAGISASYLNLIEANKRQVGGSLLLRMSIVLAGFYVVSNGHWERLLMCLLGCVIARFIVTRLTSPPADDHNGPAKEVGHAPEF